LINFRFFPIPASALLASLLVIFAAPGAAQGRAYPAAGMALELSTGYRVDQFDWNIAGNSAGTSPNVLSELTWTDLEIAEFSVLGRKTINNIYIRGSLNLGFIHSGANRDSDYSGDNRTLEFSRTENNGGDGTVWDASLGAGYSGLVLAAGEGAFTLRPLVGFSVHKQNLTITDGYQVIPATGAFSGLDSTYRAMWYGPWAGFEADYAAGALTLNAELEVHAAAYRAEADWNLRSDFQHPVSFEHKANAIGVVLSLGADYAFAGPWSMGASFKHQDWHASSGTDRTFFSSGAVGDTRLNEANWTSDAFTVGVKYVY